MIMKSNGNNGHLNKENGNNENGHDGHNNNGENDQDHNNTIDNDVEIIGNTFESEDNTIIYEREKRLTKRQRSEIYFEEEYRDILMMYEPLTGVPGDFEENWCFLPLPIGSKRSIIVATESKTHSRLRNGKVVEYFKSYLPGGGVKRHTSKETTILDCVFYEPTLTYYVLDLMCWKGNYYFDCEADFRFFLAL